MTAAGSGVPDLSAFQLEVARLFFALPDSVLMTGSWLTWP